MISPFARHLGLALSTAAVLAAGAQGQAVITLINGDLPGDFMGWANSYAGDINDDGYDDVLVGAPFADPNGSSSGLARIYSGKDKSILFEWHGKFAGDRFGQMVSDVGDVNLDGFPDVVIDALFCDTPNGVDSGQVEVYSGADGSVLYTWDGDAAGDGYGDAVADAGDVNGDGLPDIAVSARLNDGNGETSGMARIYSGFDGSELYTWYGDHPGDALGNGLDGAGDVNADGYADVVMGSRWDDPNGLQSGSAQVRSGLDGSVIRKWDGWAAGVNLGNSTGAAGDVNLDGYDDVIVGVWKDNFNGDQSGTAVVYSGFDGSAIYTVHGEQPGDLMGTFVSRVGDANHDGWEDFAASPSISDFPFSGSGAICVYSGKDGALLYTVYGDGNGDQLGDVLGEAGDVNADGWADMISGAYWNDAAGKDAGTARVYSGTITQIPSVGSGLAGTKGVPVLIAGGTLAAGEPMTLKLNEARPFSLAYLFVGLGALNAPFKGGVMIPTLDLVLSGLPTDKHGQFLLSTPFPSGVPSGFSLWFQYWISDPAGPKGFAASNGAHGTTP
ncbi:MAG TPA: hypothetical protein VFY71_04060 [Planctomycetota bacterium]|nr:hypothetical protein [Planctomycetota bacterium]